MTNIYFHQNLPMVEALRLAHDQGARLVWHGGQVRMAAAGSDERRAVANVIARIDCAISEAVTDWQTRQ